jgi:hypothetical protein
LRQILEEDKESRHTNCGDQDFEHHPAPPPSVQIGPPILDSGAGYVAALGPDEESMPAIAASAWKPAEPTLQSLNSAAAMRAEHPLVLALGTNTPGARPGNPCRYFWGLSQAFILLDSRSVQLAPQQCGRP